MLRGAAGTSSTRVSHRHASAGAQRPFAGRALRVGRVEHPAAQAAQEALLSEAGAAEAGAEQEQERTRSG